MKSKFAKIVYVLFGAVILFITTNKIFAETLKAEMNEDTVIVEVIYTDCEENEILEWILDDGTKVGDHDYIIQYNNIQLMDADEPGGGGGNTYFSSAAWITRDGVVSLQLAPTLQTRESWSNAKAGWDIVASATTTTSSVHWPNDPTCMYWQYKCHFQFANDKTYWNLEPSRTASNYNTVVLKFCNP